MNEVQPGKPQLVHSYTYTSICIWSPQGLGRGHMDMRMQDRHEENPLRLRSTGIAQWATGNDSVLIDQEKKKKPQRRQTFSARGFNDGL